MASFNMDLLLFRVAIIGSLVIGLMLFLPSMMMLKHDKPPPSAPHLDVKCWPPSQFTAEQVQYSEGICLQNFRRFAQNDSNHGVHPLTSSVVPSLDMDEMDPELERARELLSGGDVSTDSDGKEQAVGGLISSHTCVTVQLALSIIIYAFAHWIRSAASATGINSCIRAVQASALRSPSEHVAAADKAGLLDPTEDMATDRLTSLYQTRTLSLMYLLLHLAAALTWFILSAVNHHTVSNMVSSASVTNVHVSANRTTNTVGGSFLCDYEIRKLGNVQHYTIQCIYELQMFHNELSSASQEQALQDVTLNMICSNAALCLVLGILGLFYMFNFFLFAAKSRRHVMNPILQNAGIRTSNPSFGTTDLYLAYALSE